MAPRVYRRVVSWAAILGLQSVACSAPRADTRVLVLGFDGMDPKFIERHADRLPHLMRLAGMGGFVPLETVMPPQSPVAWSTVITGLTPGGHGIFDFVHRDPHGITPFSSMAKTTPPRWFLDVGPYTFPIGGGTIPLRQGRPFWHALEDEGIETSIIKMPTEFPPQPASGGAISGMGTPDMLGTFGTFQFFTTDPDEFVMGEVSGGEVRRVELDRGHVETMLLGPRNDFVQARPRVPVAMSIDVDDDHHAARIEIGGRAIVLAEGDWSDWVQVEFDLVPWLRQPSGIVRFFLKEAGPEFKLYASPINIDPRRPEQRVSYPSDFAAEVAASVGPFYTQGMAEETKALSARLFSREDFVVQANLVFDEEVAMYEHLLDRFTDGMMFHYFSTTDQAAHMLWGDYEAQLVPIYERADAIVGHTLERIDDDTILLVISDHGFQRFDKQVHLNTWLHQEGFLALKRGARPSRTPGFGDVDWSRTTAYAMGLNGLYINLAGREELGIVDSADAEAIGARLGERLLAWRDPANGNPVVEQLYEPRRRFAGDHLEFAPDFLVGFVPPYRMSPETGLGAVPPVAIEDNPDEWIGDHCMAHEHVPGVLFANRSITKANPSLHDIPVTVLSAFGIQPTEDMVGGDVFAAP